MNKFVKDVLKFNAKFGIEVGETPQVRNTNLRVNLIEEEAGEAIEAIKWGHVDKAAKELCDLLYVTIGAAITFGIDLDPVWDAVHQSNMQKVGGSNREDGKIMKPEGWREPDVRSILMNQPKNALVVKEDLPTINLDGEKLIDVMNKAKKVKDEHSK